MSPAKQAPPVLTIGDVINAAAAKHGVDLVLAQATAWVESGLNPHAIGDDDTSFGLYQLHEGGELDNLSVDQAFEPSLNADVALSQFAATHAATGLEGGALAAAAQRPADPKAYATMIDHIIAQINNGTDDQIQAALDVPYNPSAPYPQPPTPSPSPQGDTVPTVKQGSKGLPVEIAQRLLVAGQGDGHVGAVDGIFGPKTLDGVKAWQAAHGLGVDGIVGPLTWGSLAKG